MRPRPPRSLPRVALLTSCTIAWLAVVLAVGAHQLLGADSSAAVASGPAPTVTVTQTDPAVAPSSPSPSASSSSGPPPSASSAPDAPADLSQPPTTFDQAMAHVAAASASVTAKRFATPDANIYCAVQVAYIPPSCELIEGSIPDPAYCGDGTGATSIGRVELDDGVPAAVCNSDTIRQPNAVSLDPGTLATAGPVECLTEEIGVTCVETRSSSGFFLTRGSYHLFGPTDG